MKSKIKLVQVVICMMVFVGYVSLLGASNGVVIGDGSMQEVLPIKNPFYDAQILNKAIVADSQNKKKINVKYFVMVFKVLKKYLSDIEFPVEANKDSEIKKLNNLNKEKKYLFLKDYIDLYSAAIPKYLEFKKATPLKRGAIRLDAGGNLFAIPVMKSVTPQLSPPPKGFLSPVMVVDALGAFIAKRFKEELTIAYLEKFKVILQKNKGKGWTLLIPTTVTFLENMDPFNFKVFMATLKESFQSDFNHLDENLKSLLFKHIKEFEDKLIERPLLGVNAKLKLIGPGKASLKAKLEEKFKKTNEKLVGEIQRLQKKDLKKKESQLKQKKQEFNQNKLLQLYIKNRDIINAGALVLDMVDELKKAKHPIDVIEAISRSEYIENIDLNFSNPLRILSIASRNLKNKKGDGWLSPDEFNVLTENISYDNLRLFLGLVFIKEYSNLEKIKFGGKGLHEVISKSGIDMYLDKTIRFISKMSIIIDNINSQLKELKKIKTEKERFNMYYAYIMNTLELTEHGLEIKEFIKDKGLKKGIGEAEKYIEKARKLLEITKNIHNKSYGTALLNAVAMLKELLPPGIIKDEVLKYGTFMVSIVNAKDSKEMGKVLEAAALPVGSYRIKRTSRSTISLNAYPGVFGGVDILTTKENIDGGKEGLNLAFTAPVGLDYSWGGKKKTTKNGKTIFGPSNSLFISVIDIGAIVSFRITGADTGLPEFKWQNILAPGVYYFHGLKNSPISIGFGVQYGPQLRKIEPIDETPPPTILDTGDATTEAIITASAWRIGLIIAVDIPIFNFSSKSNN
jgi:hypothetical protein